MNKCIGILALLFISWSSFTACKTGKKPTRKNITVDTMAVKKPTDTTLKTDTVVQTTAPKVLSEEKKQLITVLTPLWQNQLSYKTFSGKAKMHYDGKGNKQDFTANFRIKKDSIIWVSVTALGGMVQVGRVYITPDSFKFINYLQKEVTSMPISLAAKLLPTPVDFSILQHLIIGDALRTTGEVTDATNFGGTWSIQVEDPSYVQQLTYNKSDSTMRTGQLRTVNISGPQAIIQYGNYQAIGKQKFADSRAINIINSGEQYYIDMNFTSADFDQSLDYPFSIPKNYTVK